MTYPLSPNNIEESELYKCAVKNCKNIGMVEAKVSLLKKYGRFCILCIDELKNQGLIEEEENINK